MQVARVPVRTFAEGDIPATLNLSFSTPESQLYKNFQAKMVTMKGASGVFGVLPGHVPTIAQLQPGIVTVEYDSDTGTTVRFRPLAFHLIVATSAAACHTEIQVQVPRPRIESKHLS